MSAFYQITCRGRPRPYRLAFCLCYFDLSEADTREEPFTRRFVSLTSGYVSLDSFAALFQLLIRINSE